MSRIGMVLIWFGQNVFLFQSIKFIQLIFFPRGLFTFKRQSAVVCTIKLFEWIDFASNKGLFIQIGGLV